MKAKHGILIILVLIVAAGALISLRQPRSADITGLTYEQLCNKNGDQWMVMEPWVDGKKISDTPCAGCMIADNHFCTTEEYTGYIKTLQPGGQSNTMETEHPMEHNAMTAHAGSKNSVGIHIYNIEFVRSNFVSGEQSELIFKIKDSSGNPVSDIEIVHDKIMHIVLVRSDLKYFDHIHPEQKELGAFSVPYTFYSPGNYRIWIDFTIDGMQHIVDFDASVSGTLVSPEPDKMQGISVIMLDPLDSVIKSGEVTELRFSVEESGMPVEIIEKFLDANAHMIAIDEELEEFNHMHDEELDGDNILSFQHIFDKMGKYKLWVQFSVGGRVRTAEFLVDVI